MWKLVIPALAVALTGCGGGGGSAGGSAAQAINLSPTAISRYKNEIGAGQVFNSTVADLNGDGLDDIVVSGWATAPDSYLGNRSGFVNLKIFIQQDNGSLIDKTDTLIGAENSIIWGSQRILVNDYDNDGRPDIAVLGFQDNRSAAPAPSVVFWNNGNSFSRSDLKEKIWAHAACAGDLNGDGLMELVTGPGPSSTDLNTIYSNKGQRQFVFNRDLTKEGISSSGACAVIKDSATGDVAIVTSNMAWHPNFSAVVKVWDNKFNFVKTTNLPSSEEPGTNADITHDIINIIPIDIDSDGKIDLITTDNGDWKNTSASGSISVLINQGNFVFKNETDTYLPNQDKKLFFYYYYSRLTVDGYPSIYLDNGGLGVSLWQLKNGQLVKYKEALLNSLASGYQYTNIYKTKNGYSLFLVSTTEYPYATFFYRPAIIN
jgi:hypothetical protein